MRTIIFVFLVVSSVGCASTAPSRCSGTARHVNHPDVPVANAAVVCPAMRGA
jgi:hypothetical protein